MRSKVTVIKPKQKWQLFDFQELWFYRELFWIFTWRDIKVRYKQTLLGIIWVVFQPLVTTGIFTIFFGKLAKIPSGNLPYELFVFIGLVFWSFFSGALSHASSSMVENANLLKKVYFPREILPLSSIVTSFVDFGINLTLLFIFVIIYRYFPSPLILIVLPLAIIITALTASGVGFFFASVNVKYRDVRYILPFFIQILLFLTPVIYPSSVVNESFRFLFALNPMTGVIDSIRQVLSGSSEVNLPMLVISIFSSVSVFILGLIYFRATERFFADNA